MTTTRRTNRQNGIIRLAGTGLRLSLAALLLTSGVAGAQMVKAPRYSGNLEAPTPQPDLPPLPPSVIPNATVVEDVVARVNDQIISRSDVERSEAQLQQEDAAQNLGPAEAANRQRDMLRDMIDQQLLLSKAKELNVNVDADVIRQLDDIRKQNNFASLDDLERAARQQGVSFEDFKSKIKNQLLTQQVVRDEVGRRLQLTPSEEAAYYNEHKNEFNQPEQVRLSEILVPLPENATDAQIRQAETKANALKTQVMQGANFADLAKKNSGGPTAAQGGELGLFKRGALAKVLEDQTFDLKPGETTQPIRTRQGFVILKVTAHQEAGPAPLKDVEPQVQESIYMSQMQPALRKYLTRLREESYVNLAPGFVDTGASGKETQPILFSAYTPPPVKKKAAQDKARFDRRGAYTPVSATSTRGVVASPDTTGGRTLTGKEATAAAETPVDPNTGLAVISAPANRSGKVKRIKREKLRFGQAPRISLASNGLDSAPAGTPTAVPATSAPGVSMASGGLPGLGQQPENADPSDNPLTPKPAPVGKTRFSTMAVEHKDDKLQKTAAKQQEKIASRPVEITPQEKETAQAQAAPLGLAGDTTKKPAKAKKVKGQAKARLEDEKTEKPADSAVPLTANPGLAPATETGEPAKAPAPKADSTTLPPVTTPVQGQPQQGPTTPQQQPGTAPPPPQ